MVRITIDDALKEKLLGSGDVVELCDESGRLLGRILPQKEDPLEGWTPLMPELSEEEYQRRLASNEPGLTTEQLKERLRNMS